MSKIRLRLSYKNILILKHSLERRIKFDEEELGYIEDGVLHSYSDEELEKMKKEHEEHKCCLEALIKQMAIGGYRYTAGQESNVFGEKYLEKYNEQFKK